MRELTPNEAFAERLRVARQSAGMSQAKVVEELQRLGYHGLKKPAIIDIEQNRRRVSLDEALALSAAVGVAPVNMIVPFESDRVLRAREIGDVPDGVEVTEKERARLERLREALAQDQYAIDATLKVGDGSLVPEVARAWIRGVRHWPDFAPPPTWHQYYVKQIPPLAQARLREAADKVAKRWKAARSRLGRLRELEELVLPEAKPLPDEVPLSLAVPGFEPPVGRSGFPMPLGTVLMFEAAELLGDGVQPGEADLLREALTWDVDQTHDEQGAPGDN